MNADRFGRKCRGATNFRYFDPSWGSLCLQARHFANNAR
jgi:hypothetical protein